MDGTGRNKLGYKLEYAEQLSRLTNFRDSFYPPEISLYMEEI